MSNFDNDEEPVDADVAGDRLSAYHAGTISTNAPGLRPNWPRLVIKNWRYFVAAIVPTLLAAAGFYGVNHFYEAEKVIPGTWLLLLSTPLALLAAFFWWLSVMSARVDAIAVAKGLLTPAIVSPDRRQLYCLANISCDDELAIYGLKAIPFRARQGESEVACASTFQEGESLERWEGFTPLPLRWGSSQHAQIEGCKKRIPPEMWQGLRLAMQQLALPADDRMLILDEQFQLVEEVSSRRHRPQADADGKPAETPGCILTAGALMIGLGCFVLLIGSLLATIALGQDARKQPWQVLVPALAFPGLGLTGILAGIALRWRLYRTAGVLILIAIGLMATLALFSPMD
jgi:hypothetical protein